MQSYTRSYLQGIGLNEFTGSVALADVSLEVAAGQSVPEKDGDSFRPALDDAFASALTKFDNMEAQFKHGRSVKDICSMFIDELQGERELLPFLAVPENEKLMRTYVQTTVGTAYGKWKKGSSGGVKVQETKQVRPVPLPWSNIDAYPEWVLNQIWCYTNATPEEQEEARQKLEKALLETPVRAVSVKYDGTCFGKMDSGELCGRREVLGQYCTEYLHTSTAMTKPCDVAALRHNLAGMLETEVGQVCVWGELMCNPNFYSYIERGLAGTWICFGVIATLLNNPDTAAISLKLAKDGFAHSTTVNASGSCQLRLLICPALRKLLKDAGACHVVQDQFQRFTHAEVVAQGASGLRDGENEGLVLVFERPNGQASLRKWKNSAEGANARQKEARLLRECHSLCVDLVSESKLDSRVADMVDTLRSVAEAKTSPMKKNKSNKKAA